MYKDLWNDARSANRQREARGYLRNAIEEYRRGFEADWRDAYPGINAVTLMAISGDEAGVSELLPIVRYSAKRRVVAGELDYWDHATLLELAVIGRNASDAERRAGDALTALREGWEAETTANNLRLLRESRHDHPTWATEIEEELKRAAAERSP